MLKKLIAVGASLAVALGIVALVALPAQAHDHDVDATCTAITLHLTNYADDSTASHKNTAKVTVNGAVLFENDDFGSNLSKTVTMPTGQRTLNWTVTVTAWDSSQYGFTQSGTETECAPPPTAATGSVTPHQATCDVDHPGQKTTAWYEIDAASTAVTYTASVNGGPATGVGTGRHDVALGGSAVTVVVTAATDKDHQLVGTNPFPMTFTPVAGDCLTHLTVGGKPTVTPAVCVAAGQLGDGTITFPALPAGAKWQYSSQSSTGSWIDAPASLTEPAGTTVWAQIVVTGSGYTIDNPAATGPFTLVIDSADATHCVTAVPSLQQTQAVCDASNPGKIPSATFTVPDTTGVVYSYQGTKVNGTTQDVTVGSTAVTVTVTATPAAGYSFPTGTANPTTITLHFQPLDHAGCVFAAVAAHPVFTESTCDATTPGGKFAATYVLSNTVGVLWHVSIDGGPVTDTAPGTYTATPGSTIVVTETPDTGFTLTDYPPVGQPGGDADGYHHTFAADAGDCLTDTPVASPTVTPEVCTEDLDGHGTYSGGTIDFATADHVTYFLDSDTTPIVGPVSKTVTLGVDHIVTALADTGYRLTGYPVGGWTFNLTAAAPCGDLVTHPLVDPTVTSTQGGCFAAPSYTLSSDLVSLDPKAVVWTVNGSPVNAGSYTATAGSTVTVHAAPAAGYGFAAGTQTDWTLHFTAAGPCDLKTLALTGTGSPIGWIGLGYLLLVLGLGLVAVPLILRRRAAQR